MVQSQPFYVGAHVRTIAPLAELPVGVQGVICAVFPLGDLYDVLFAEGIRPRVVHRDKLELIRPSKGSAVASST